MSETLIARVRAALEKHGIEIQEPSDSYADLSVPLFADVEPLFVRCAERKHLRIPALFTHTAAFAALAKSRPVLVTASPDDPGREPLVHLTLSDFAELFATPHQEEAP